MQVLLDHHTCALLGLSKKRISEVRVRRRITGKHRPIPERVYVIGTVLYTGILVAIAGGASWAFLVLALSPT